MSRPKSFRRGVSAYRRGRPRSVAAGKTILIVTEGEKTEPNYLKALRNRFQLSATDIEIVHPEGTDPITLVKEASRLRDWQRKAVKNGHGVVYDEVWVVFDLEQIHDERRELACQAMALPEAKKMRFAISDPCFEFWLLLHEKQTTASFADCRTVISRLKDYWPDYSKGQSVSADILDKVPTAVVN